MSHRIKACPEWRYALADVVRHYAELERDHYPGKGAAVATLAASLGRLVDVNPALILRTPAAQPACAHLARAARNGGAAVSGLTGALAGLAGELLWKPGDADGAGWAHAALAGPEGPVTASELALTLIIATPHATFPAPETAGALVLTCLSGVLGDSTGDLSPPGAMLCLPPGARRGLSAGREPVLLLAGTPLAG